jgi:hypothetical protein
MVVIEILKLQLNQPFTHRVHTHGISVFMAPVFAHITVV